MKLTGLTSQQVEQSRATHGANMLTPPPRIPWWQEFLSKFEDPVIRILIIAALISFGVGLLEKHISIESIGIVIAILLATGLAFWNERKANAEFDVLNTTSDEVAVKVMRDGGITTVGRKEIVVGDVVLLDQGDEIPADGHVLEATSLEVNEAAFTGESLPARKNAGENQGGTFDSNQLLRSTMVVDGGGVLQVEKVGDATQIGQIAKESTEDTGDISPLNQQLGRLSKWIGVLGFAIAAGTFIALILRGYLTGELALSGSQWFVAVAGLVAAGVALTPVWLPLVYDFFELTGREKESPAWLENGAKTWLVLFVLGLLTFALLMGIGIALGQIPSSPANWLPLSALERFLQFFMIAVTIIVVAVPEGLAMSVTLSLAYSMRRMTASNCLVRKMDACETIGAATHICSDKTGTLTMNEMRVQEGYFGHTDKNAAQNGGWNQSKIADNFVFEAMAVNSTANLGQVSAAGQGEPRDADKDGKLDIIGNPTEGAMLLWMGAKGTDYAALRGEFQSQKQWPFSTERKFMATLGTSAQGNTFHVKGAPDIVLARCATRQTAEGQAPFSQPQRDQILAAIADCSARGMRTLAFAAKSGNGVSPEADLVEEAQNLNWLGFVAIADPVRPEVKDAVEKCRIAGIEVKIVTGDNPYTASEIGRQIGLFGAGPEAQTAGARPGEAMPNDVMLGPDFAALSDAEATQAALRLKVLARARPADKLRLVNSLANQGAVVAVTGDGTNDAPALNQAAVGLAMGKAGTAVAKEASDMILLDDSFGTIATAVKWGRALYLNIQKFILFQLTINVVACGIAFLGPFIGIELPLTVMQMLWVNLIMDTFAALALATEPPEPNVMNNAPRGPQDFIVTPEMMRKIFSIGLIFLALMILALKIPVFSERTITLIPSSEIARGTMETTAFFTFFVLLQFWNQFNARTLGSVRSAFDGILANPYFLSVSALILVGQILIVTFGGQAFRVVPLSVDMWIKLLAVTSLVLWIGEIARFIARMGGPKTPAPQVVNPANAVRV
ncbi:Ca2+-transporting ATPase [Abditibacterium utsteinense]|uniref:Ca2+-transporting ATPase n=1 Tax=Abditibacterium utsteinense TaxID=1960156 RepID=A0A2S8SQ55_9BACT|nr:calcium-translocating P-type ATPase, PMCA-type [Abditibacterium utsteinense]PQV62933.1 Ca2+-transporting ATPase [Abditibacterium utsteinense]